MSNIYTAKVEYDKDLGYFLLFPQEVITETGWKEGDTLEWIDQGDGSWLLRKVEKKVWVMVEAVQQYRMRYMVEAPADHPEYALDDVTCQTAKEFSQLDLGETIVSHRVMGSTAEALVECDLDNTYTSGWTDAQKIRAFFTKEGESRDY